MQPGHCMDHCHSQSHNDFPYSMTKMFNPLLLNICRMGKKEREILLKSLILLLEQPKLMFLVYISLPSIQKYFNGCRTCSPPLQVYLADLKSYEMSRDRRRNSSLSLLSSRMWRRVVWYRIRTKQSGVYTKDGETRYLEMLIFAYHVARYCILHDHELNIRHFGKNGER